MVGVLRNVGIGGLVVWLLANVKTILDQNLVGGEARLSALAATVAVTSIGVLVVLLAAKALERLDRSDHRPPA